MHKNIKIFMHKNKYIMYSVIKGNYENLTRVFTFFNICNILGLIHVLTPLEKKQNAHICKRPTSSSPLLHNPKFSRP